MLSIKQPTTKTLCIYLRLRGHDALIPEFTYKTISEKVEQEEIESEVPR